MGIMAPLRVRLIPSATAPVTQVSEPAVSPISQSVALQEIKSHPYLPHLNAHLPNSCLCEKFSVGGFDTRDRSLLPR